MSIKKKKVIKKAKKISIKARSKVIVVKHIKVPIELKTREEVKKEAKRLGCFHYNKYHNQWEIILTDNEYQGL